VGAFGPFILGFALSAAVQGVVSYREMIRLLRDDGSLSIATVLLVPKHILAIAISCRSPVTWKAWEPIVGPLVAINSFVCSVGNVFAVAIFWSDGISFGGVVAFIFANLIVLPILDMYRKN